MMGCPRGLVESGAQEPCGQVTTSVLVGSCLTLTHTLSFVWERVHEFRGEESLEVDLLTYVQGFLCPGRVLAAGCFPGLLIMVQKARTNSPRRVLKPPQISSRLLRLKTRYKWRRDKDWFSKFGDRMKRPFGLQPIVYSRRVKIVPEESQAPENINHAPEKAV